ncbi:MAG: outer membrane lipoprotein carrier protein LolA [Bacteroidetes bacterium]|nr:outer membrane lipoprotein carrier protein LolA [Bacteroidota bacterium]
MKRLILILLTGTTGIAAAQQPNAAQIMERFGARMRESAALELHFDFLGADAKGVALDPLAGVMYIQGNDYVVLNAEVEVYVQGVTKWVYTPGINEAIIMGHDPLSADLADNPFLLFSAKLSRDYRLTDKPEYYSDKGVDIVALNLIPTAKNPAYTSLLLRINSRTFLPHSLLYLSKDGARYEAVITACTLQNEGYPPDHFVFKEKEHPGVFISDLR